MCVEGVTHTHTQTHTHTHTQPTGHTLVELTLFPYNLNEMTLNQRGIDVDLTSVPSGRSLCHQTLKDDIICYSGNPMPRIHTFCQDKAPLDQTDVLVVCRPRTRLWFWRTTFSLSLSLSLSLSISLSLYVSLTHSLSLTVSLYI